MHVQAMGHDNGVLLWCLDVQGYGCICAGLHGPEYCIGLRRACNQLGFQLALWF